MQIFRRSGRRAVRAPACLLPPSPLSDCPRTPVNNKLQPPGDDFLLGKKKKACVRPLGIKVGCMVGNKLALFTSPFPNAKVRL